MFDKITKLTVGATTYCNFECVYCHQCKTEKEKNNFFTSEMTKKLYDFLLHIPLDDEVEIRLLGGEVSLFPSEIERFIKQINKVAQKKDVKLYYSMPTNGSNIDTVLKLIDKQLVRASNITFSWDGIYSCSKSRKPKNDKITDTFLNNQIKKVGNSIYNRDINVVFAVTPETISTMYESLLFLLDNNLRNFSFYFINEGNYNNKNFLEEYQKQLVLIGKKFIECYSNPFMRFQYHNWNVLFHRSFFPQTAEFVHKFAKCKNLGQIFHVTNTGDLYPCVIFGDHKISKLGDLDSGFNMKAIEKFVQECLEPLSCNYKKCGNLHCHECPAATLLYKKSISARFMNQCALRKIEKNVFNELFDPEMISQEEIKTFWCLNENEREEFIYKPGYLIPTNQYEMKEFNAILSDTVDYVNSGEWFK